MVSALDTPVTRHSVILIITHTCHQTFESTCRAGREETDAPDLRDTSPFAGGSHKRRRRQAMAILRYQRSRRLALAPGDDDLILCDELDTDYGDLPPPPAAGAARRRSLVSRLSSWLSSPRPSKNFPTFYGEWSKAWGCASPSTALNPHDDESKRALMGAKTLSAPGANP